MKQSEDNTHNQYQQPQQPGSSNYPPQNTNNYHQQVPMNQMNFGVPEPVSLDTTSPPPMYTDFDSPSNESTRDFAAPNYFDISRIPRGNVLYPHNFRPVNQLQA